MTKFVSKRKTTKKQEKEALELVLELLHFCLANIPDHLKDEGSHYADMTENLYYMYVGWMEGCNLRPNMMKNLHKEINKFKKC